MKQCQLWHFSSESHLSSYREIVLCSMTLRTQFLGNIYGAVIPVQQLTSWWCLHLCIFNDLIYFLMRCSCILFCLLWLNFCWFFKNRGCFRSVKWSPCGVLCLFKLATLFRISPLQSGHFLSVTTGELSGHAFSHISKMNGGSHSGFHRHPLGLA